MKRHLILTALIASLGAGLAQTDPATTERGLHFQTGIIPIEQGQVRLDTGSTLRYLGPEGARTVIVDLWGNPAEQAEGVLGMIFPVAAGPTADNGWGLVITRSHDGHVSDDDAAGADYAQVMRDLRSGLQDENADRKKAGYQTLDLVGWADPPRYDAATHKMYWAKEIAFAGESDHTLNYAVRILGRDSVLQLNAVSGMRLLPQVRGDMQAVLKQVSFTPGQRYEDYQPGSDKLAGYGVAALVGGVAAKKLGLLAGGALLLKKGWFLLLAAFGWVARRFGSRREA